MANNNSARKRVRQTDTRTARNRVVKSRLKSYRKAALAAIETGKSKKAQEAFDQFASAADRAAKNHVIHKNTAKRLKSRVATRLNAL